ncbi:MAG: hypothetical protein A4E65_02006 [Syntrophorhabdus sp. PtaU1.Bin153]|nr:MAG: hypothetical protein A4E65_02006 [Syntrophorhabdus sp. PtaU1.Bin153]
MDRTVCPLDRCTAVIDGDLPAVLCDEDRMVGESHHAAHAEDLVYGALHGFTGLLVDDPEDGREGLTQGFCPPAGQTLGLGIEEGDPALPVRNDDGITDTREGCPEEFSAFLEGILGELPFGDVPPHRIGDLFPLDGDYGMGDFNPDIAAVKGAVEPLKVAGPFPERGVHEFPCLLQRKLPIRLPFRREIGRTETDQLILVSAPHKLHGSLVAIDKYLAV